MGGACLRGHGHPWPAGGAGCPAARGRQSGELAREPDAAGPHTRTQPLRAGRDPHTIRLGNGQGQPNPVSNAEAVDVWIRQPVRNRDHQRQRHALSIADRHGDADGVALVERQPEGLELALGPRQQSFESVQE